MQYFRPSLDLSRDLIPFSSDNFRIFSSIYYGSGTQINQPLDFSYTSPYILIRAYTNTNIHYLSVSNERRVASQLSEGLTTTDQELIILGSPC